MFKVMIVDDEAIERQAMRKLLAEGEPLAEVAAEAANGKEAVRLAGEVGPDIILMDIKMPGMDGVEAVRLIRRENPQVKFIMVSAFDTFEYAREVMQEGVKEYLLKPSKRDEILKTLGRVMEEVRAERERVGERVKLQRKLERAVSFVRSEWVTSLLLDHLHETEAAGWLEFLDMKKGAVYAVVCRISYPEAEGSNETLLKLYSRLKKAFEAHSDCLVGPMASGQVPIFVIARDQERKSVRAQAVGLVKACLAEFDQAASGDEVSIRIGIGTEVHDPNDFIHSFEEALIALEETNERVRSFVYHPHLVQSPEAGIVKAEKRLLEVIKDGDPGGTLSALEFYMHELQGNPDSAVKRVGSLLWMTVKMAEEMGLILQINDSLPEGTPFSQLKEWTQVQVMIAVEEFRKVHTERTSGFLRKAQVYIDKHFGAAVSLEDVAEHVGLSAYYFSKLFKEQSGTTFIDYLTEVRIRRGKQLLQETRMSLKEICYEVGYRDPNYFSRVFKKITGRTPSDYRSSIQG